MSEAVLHVDLTGQSGPVAAKLHRFPVRPGRRPGELRYVRPDFGAEFIVKLFDAVPLAQRVGPPWNRRNICRTCATELGEPSVETLTLSLDVSGAPAFEVELRLPIIRCSQCGEAQGPGGREFEAHISEALTRALDSLHIRPE